MSVFANLDFDASSLRLLNMAPALALASFVLPFVYALKAFAKLLWKNYVARNHSVLRNVPAPKLHPVLSYIIGDKREDLTGLTFGRTTLEIAHGKIELSNQLGPVFYLPRICGVPVVQVLDVDLLQYISISAAYKYHKTALVRRILQPVLGERGLVFAEDDEHKRVRRVVAPTLHNDAVARCSIIFLQEADRLTKNVLKSCTDSPDLALNVNKLTSHASCNTILRAFFREDTLSNVSLDRLREAYCSTIGNVNYILKEYLLNSFFKLIPHSVFMTDSKHKSTIRDEVDTLLESALSDSKQTGVEGKPDDATQFRSMLDIILDSNSSGSKDKTSSRPGLTRSEISDSLLNNLGAGQGTTGMILGWMMYRLARHTDWQLRIQKEVDACEAFTDTSLSPIGRVDTIDALPTLDRFLKECLRLHPPVMYTTRTLNQADKLAGYDIPAGTDFCISIIAIHMNPKYWEMPNIFDPDRFTPEAEAARHPMAWCPFLFGVRGCIGRRFAVLETKCMIAQMLACVDLSLSSKYTEPVVRGGFSLTPDVDIFARRRSTGTCVVASG